MYMFHLCIYVKVKEYIKRFLEEILPTFYVTSYIRFAASLLVNCQYV